MVAGARPLKALSLPPAPSVNTLHSHDVPGGEPESLWPLVPGLGSLQASGNIKETEGQKPQPGLGVGGEECSQQAAERGQVGAGPSSSTWSGQVWTVLRSSGLPVLAWEGLVERAGCPQDGSDSGEGVRESLVGFLRSLNFILRAVGNMKGFLT